jgi:hypothetical protein
VAPLAPFLDPASSAFEDPEKFGLKRLATTLEEHIRLLSGPTWEQVLNYETGEMNREQIVTTMYASLEKLNDFKLKYGLITLDAHRKIAVETRAVTAWMERIRNAVRAGTRFENLPVFEEPTGNATRTQSELRWKVKRRYPHILSFVSIGFMSLLDELRAIALRRQSRWKYSAPRSINDPDRVLARAEPEPDPEPLGLTGD